MEKFYSLKCLKKLPAYRLYCFYTAFTISLLFTSEAIFAQNIFIHQRSNLVMNGSVLLVVNNAAFTNDGAFAASAGTVKFSGYKDTSTSYVAGSSTTTFNNLTIDKTFFGTKVKGNAEIKNVLGVYGGKLYADSNLTLLSTATATAQVDEVAVGSDIIGKVKVERYIPSRRAWRLMTAPVTASNTILNSWQNNGVYTAGKGTLVSAAGATGPTGNGIDVSPQANVSMKKWDYATQQFVSIANTKAPLSAGSSGSADNTGYFIFLRGDRDVTNFNVPNSNNTTLTSVGKLQTGTQSFTVSPVANKYSLVGNPYASPVDFNKVSLTNVTRRFYTWDPTLNALGGYVTMDDYYNTGSFIKSAAGSAQTTDIQSSQAFFVQTKAAGAASVTFTESSKSASNSTNVFRPFSPAGPVAAPSVLRASLYLLNADSSLTLADGSIAEFNSSATDSVEMEDALKFTNTNENIALQRHGSTLSIERRPLILAADTLYLKIWKTTQRDYQLQFVPQAFEPLHVKGYLQDSYLHTSAPISLGKSSTINFTIDGNAASAATGRFIIVFEKEIFTLLPVTISSLSASKKNKDIAVDWKVENELNMLKYDVEKSTDGARFANVHTQMVTGNSNAANSYAWLDEKVTSAINFYRIKMYGNNGKETYSTIVKVAASANSGFSINQSPIQNNTLQLQVNNTPAGTYQLTLTNAEGQVFYTSALHNTGSGNYAINLNTKLAAGIYYLSIAGPGSTSTTQKIIAP